MRNAHVPVIGFSAYSGTGKTTLITQLIPQLKQHGLRLGLIKQTHHDLDIDSPGKDSYRFRQAGADTVMLVSAHRRAIMTEFTLPRTADDLSDQLAALDQSNLDVILVEGFKHAPFPKIELRRSELNKPLLYPNDPYIIALASDVPLPTPPQLTLLDINQPEHVTQFIRHFIQSAAPV